MFKLQSKSMAAFRKYIHIVHHFYLLLPTEYMMHFVRFERFVGEGDLISNNWCINSWSRVVLEDLS